MRGTSPRARPPVSRRAGSSSAGRITFGIWKSARSTPRANGTSTAVAWSSPPTKGRRGRASRGSNGSRKTPVRPRGSRPTSGRSIYVYIYGIPGGRSGGVKLGRVAYGDIEDFESYEYYKSKDASGTVTWRKGSNGLKSIKTDNNSYIVAPSCGEISVHYNAYLQRYVMSYMQNNSKIVIRRSATPWGDWSASDIIMDQSNLQGLYGGFSHAAMSDHDGKRIYLFVSEWYPTYNVHLIEVVFA